MLCTVGVRMIELLATGTETDFLPATHDYQKLKHEQVSSVR